MNKFVYTLLVSAVIFAQAAVAMQKEDQSHTALASDSKPVDKIIEAQVPSIPKGVRALVVEYAGDYFTKKVTLGRNGLAFVEGFGYSSYNLIGMTFSVAALKVILEIDDAEGDLLPAPASTPTATYFTKASSFLYRGKEFLVNIHLPNAFISRRNYKDDEVISAHPDYALHPHTGPAGQQVKLFHLPNRDICLLPKDRFKSWVGLPGAGLRSGSGELLDPDKYYCDGSIDTEKSEIEVSEKLSEEQKEEQKGS